jgi:hypothetical protein
VQLDSEQSVSEGDMPPAGVPTHEALFYSNEREYWEGLDRFLAPALSSGEPVALALPAGRLEPAREWLGNLPDRELLDMSELGRNPGRILSAIDRLQYKHRGRTLHYVGEPIWPGRSPEEIREAVRHEALINVALHGTRTRVLCPYDARGLEDWVLESAARTHPTLVEQGAAYASETYSEAVPREAELPLDAPPAGAVSNPIGEDLGATRGAVRGYGETRDLRGQLLDDLELVAHELASNAMRHGGPPRKLALWQVPRPAQVPRTARLSWKRRSTGKGQAAGEAQVPGEVVCQVENSGAIADPLAGRRAPERQQDQGVGLWIVHQLCDLVEVRNGARTTVRAHLRVD